MLSNLFLLPSRLIRVSPGCVVGDRNHMRKLLTLES